MDWRYYFESGKFTGEVDCPTNGDTILYTGIAYTLSRGFVGGIDYTNEENEISAGFTYTGHPVIIDFKYLNKDSYRYYKASGMFKLGEDYGLGLEYLKYNNTTYPQYTAKFKYTVTDNTYFKVLFTPKNDDVSQSYSFAYYHSL